MGGAFVQASFALVTNVTFRQTLYVAMFQLIQLQIWRKFFGQKMLTKNGEKNILFWGCLHFLGPINILSGPHYFCRLYFSCLLDLVGKGLKTNFLHLWCFFNAKIQNPGQTITWRKKVLTHIHKCILSITIQISMLIFVKKKRKLCFRPHNNSK